MITTPTITTAYERRAAGTVQDTVYVFYLAGSAIYFSTGPVSGLTTQQLMMDRPSLAPSSVSPLEGSSAIGTVSLSLLDQDSYVTDLRAAAPIVGQEAELWIGYIGLAWGVDYLRVLKGKVRSFGLASSGCAYDIVIADRWSEANISRFEPKDVAAEPDATSTTPAPDKTWDGGTLTVRDADVDGVYDTVIIEDADPVTIALKMLLSDGALDGSQSGYNVWPAWAGCGLTTSEVDVTWCETEQDKVLLIPMRFTLNGAENVKAFIETELCRAIGGYTLISGEGKLRVHYPSAPIRTATLAAVTDDHLTQRPTWGDSYDLYLSHVRFELDHDGSEFGTLLPPLASYQYLDATYDEEREHRISSRGLQSDLGGISIARTVVDQLFRRYSDPPPRIKLSVFFAKHLIEAGDVITLTTDYLRDTDGQGVGATRYLEVLRVAPSGSRVELDCIDLTGANTSPPIAIIAASGDPPADTYGAATTADRAYCFIANAATGLFSNGDAAYVPG
jgi:hypothetical protein